MLGNYPLNEYMNPQSSKETDVNLEINELQQNDHPMGEVLGHC